MALPDFAGGDPQGIVMNSGWIKLHRRLREHPFWPVDRPYSKLEAWIDLLLSANHKSTSVNFDFTVINVTRGQCITSQVKLAKKWNWHRETVSKFLRLLEREDMASIETSNKTSSGFTLITIQNYEKYQGVDSDETSSQADNHQLLDSAENLDSEASYRTSSDNSDDTLELLSDYDAGALPHPTTKSTSKPATARQPSGTNKNDKNEKNLLRSPKVSDLNHRRRSNGTKPQPVPGFKETMALYSDLFVRRVGAKPDIDGGRDGKLLSGLLKAHGADEVTCLLRYFFEHPPPWVEKNGKFTIPAFKSAYTELLAQSRNGKVQMGVL
jgi:hypothetical protein